MIAPDVNVLVAALHAGAADHAEMRSWLEDAVNGEEPVAVTAAVASGTLRVLTHPRVFAPPVPVERAVAAVMALLEHPNVTMLHTGPRHWSLLRGLVLQAAAKGNLVADAAHAATAIEGDLTWVTKDRDFARFPGLRWRVPTSGQG